ncbi:MAG: EamA family transporter [Bacteroidetes bacterium]|nr:EamA family transporter [Bacteroidota bacterium]
MSKENIKIGLAYVLICLLWGSTWMVIRIGLETLTPMIYAGTRFLLASIFIYIIMRMRGTKLQKDKASLNLYWIMGIFSFVIPFWLVYWAEQFIPSGLTSIIFAVYPFFVIIFTRIIIKDEKIGPYKIIGVLLGFLGIIIIFMRDISIDFSSSFWGMLAILSSAVIQAAIAVIIKKYGKHLNPLSMNFVPVLLGGTIMVILGFIAEDYTTWIFNQQAILSIAYLAFFGTVVTFTTFYWLMQRISVVILSLSTFITPIIAVFLGWFILHEKLSALTLLGSSLVLIGILFANFRGLKNYFLSRHKKVQNTV